MYECLYVLIQPLILFIIKSYTEYKKHKGKIYNNNNKLHSYQVIYNAAKFIS